MQLALDLPIPAVPERRTALKVAKRRGDQAIAAGAEKAKRIDPAFIEAACAHVRAYLTQHGTSSGEMLVDSCKLAGIRSDEDRHFGAVFRRLLNAKQIRCTRSDVPRARGHGSSGGKLYELVRA